MLENRGGGYTKIVQVSPGENFPSHPRDQRTDENFWFDHASMAQLTATPEAVQTPDPLRELIISLPRFHLKVPTILRAG